MLYLSTVLTLITLFIFDQTFGFISVYFRFNKSKRNEQTGELPFIISNTVPLKKLYKAENFHPLSQVFTEIQSLGNKQQLFFITIYLLNLHVSAQWSMTNSRLKYTLVISTRHRKQRPIQSNIQMILKQKTDIDLTIMAPAPLRFLLFLL